VGTIAAGAALFLQLVLFQAGAGWAWTGKVVGIADGDTITVLRDGHEQVKIRLYGIDAPESGQPFGKASKQNLSSMVHGQSVQIEVMDTDRYGRTVARIFVDGEDVNAAQLRSGHAWLYRQYCKTWVCGEWAGLETEARSNGAGLWADKDPTPPWQWRRDEKGSSTSWVEKFLRIPVQTDHGFRRKLTTDSTGN
jgi:endonuclease YncB( thermonuclease family)